MTSKKHLPREIFTREFDRLNNDRDRLQMLMTLKLHLKNLVLTSADLQMICERFIEEKYRLQAIEQLIPWVRLISFRRIQMSVVDLYIDYVGEFNRTFGTFLSA